MHCKSPLLQSGVCTSLRFCFVFLIVDECYRDLSPVETIAGGWITSGWPTTRSSELAGSYKTKAFLTIAGQPQKDLHFYYTCSSTEYVHRRSK
jgi:hypothetical protein